MQTKVGEGHLCSRDQAGDEILKGNGRRFECLAVVPFEEEDESPFVGLLQAEAVGARNPVERIIRPIIVRPPD